MNEQRLCTILNNMKEDGLRQFVITDPMTIFYLTGRLIQPYERFYALYLNANGRHRIFINTLETVPEDFGIPKIRFGDADPYLDLLYDVIEHDKPLGIDKNMPAKFLLPLLHRDAATAYIDASVHADRARGVKDMEEIALMRRASEINDAAMAEFKLLLCEGVRETDVSAQIKDIYLRLGGEGYSFEPLVAFGENAACGHFAGGDRRLRRGDCILLDVGCKYRGYCSDMTRTFFFQEVSEKHRAIYDVVLEANEAAEELVRPGVPLHELDDCARAIISRAGYGEYFTHRLGHFIGLDDHDFGDVSAAAKDCAVAGNIFSIEPGVYIEGEVGIRIEDLVLVTESGVERLNHYPKALEIVG